MPRETDRGERREGSFDRNAQTAHQFQVHACSSSSENCNLGGSILNFIKENRIEKNACEIHYFLVLSTEIVYDPQPE